MYKANTKGGVITMEKDIGIYKITNKLNGKCYVGSSKDIQKRWYQHINIYKNTIIHKAINKYGCHNFEFQILERCNKRLLIEREQFYYDSLLPEYNMIRPIENPMDNPLVQEVHKKAMNTKEFKEKMQAISLAAWRKSTQARKYKFMISNRTESANSKRIKTMNADEFIKAQSGIMKKVWENQEYRDKHIPNKIKILKEITQRKEVREKHSINGKRNWENKQYREYIISQTTALKRKKTYLHDGEKIHEFESISECGRYLSKIIGTTEVNATANASKALNTGTNAAYGFALSFTDSIEPYVKKKKVIVNRTKVHDIKVVQLNKNTSELINIFDSISDGARHIGVGPENISRVCKGKMETSKGYKWMYYEDYQALTK